MASCTVEDSPQQTTTEIAEVHPTEHKHGGLGQLASTAICGNDITSSCLYVSSLAIIYAGRWAPLVLLMVVAVLYLYRSIYAEVVGALPLNGGAYNALLNTTSKYRASIAACLTILSYMATGVISASEAMNYAHSMWNAVPVFEATIALLAGFTLLTCLGITESSRVAVVIFVAHLTSLAILLVAGIAHVAMHGTEILMANMQTPVEGGVWKALFFGFSASLLGISGFESSANFVEEQAEGVFPKTLRNMWLAVTIFNPAMALLALSLVPIAAVKGHDTTLLAYMGDMSAGQWLSWLISIDAVLVLSGAVLTSFVGVNGLVHRMTLDRCLPQFLLKSNRRNTTHRIIISFFVLCVSVLYITEGRLKELAGVYALSFLSVMTLFALGNILLKEKRSHLPRPTRASWFTVIVAISAVLGGLIGNAIRNPEDVGVFFEYFIPALLIVSIMLGRITLLKLCLRLARAGLTSFLSPRYQLAQAILKKINEINSQQMVFFTRGANLPNLNKAMLYVIKNEHTNRIKIVSAVRDKNQTSAKIERDIKFLDELYPDVDIEYVELEAEFGPALIDRLSKEWDIPKNFMFIGSPGDRFIYGLAELGGVRLIV